MKDSYNIRINTGLKDFVLIDSINEVDKDKIIGAREFFNAPIFLGIESIAQLGAYHVRFLTSFDRHAFLLKINSFFIPENEALDGNYILYGYLIKRSLTAFLYKLEAKRGYKICFKGEFLYANVDYGRNFKKDILEDHYRTKFLCLKKNSK